MKKFISIVLVLIIMAVILSGCDKSKVLTDIMHKSPDNISEITIFNYIDNKDVTIIDKATIKKVFNEFKGIKVVKLKQDAKMGDDTWNFRFTIPMKNGKIEYLYITTDDGKLMHIDRAKHIAVKSVLDIDKIRVIFSEIKATKR